MFTKNSLKILANPLSVLIIIPISSSVMYSVKMREIKLPQVGLKLARLLTTRHKFVWFGVTSSVDIDCARSSLCQACQLSRESIGTEIRGSWVRVPRETDFISQIEKP